MSSQNRIQGRQGEHRAAMLFLWLSLEVKQFEIDDGADLIVSDPGGMASIDVQVKTAQRAEMKGRQLRKALDNLSKGRPHLLLHLQPEYPHDPVAWVTLRRWVRHAPEMVAAVQLDEAAEVRYAPPHDAWTPFPTDPRVKPADLAAALRAEMAHVGNSAADPNSLYLVSVEQALARPEELPFLEATQQQHADARESVYGEGLRFKGTAEHEVKLKLVASLERSVGQAASPRDEARTLACVKRFFRAIEHVERHEYREALAALPNYERVELGVWRYLLAHTGTAVRLVDLAVAHASELSAPRLRALMGVLSGLAAANETAAPQMADTLLELHPLRELDGLKSRNPVDHLAALGHWLGTPNGLGRTAFDVHRQWAFSMLEARGAKAYADLYLQLFSHVGDDSYVWHLQNWSEYYGVGVAELQHLIGPRWSEPSARHSRAQPLHELWHTMVTQPPRGANA